MKISTTFAIALRNARRQRRRALLLGGAVAIGCFVATLTDGMTGGMSRSLRSNIETSNVGELYIYGEEWRRAGDPVQRILDDRILRDAVARSGMDIQKLVQVSRAQANLVFNGRSQRTTLVGIPWTGGDSALGTPALREGSLEGMQRENGIVIPDTLAARLGVAAGESLLVKTTTVTGQANVAEFVVAAIASSQGGGLFESSYARLETMGALLGLPEGGYQSLHLYLRGEPDLEAASRSLLASLESSGAVVESRNENPDEPGPPGGDSRPMSMLFSGGAVSGETWAGTRYSVETLDDVAGQLTSLLASIRVVSMVVFAALLAISMAGVVNTFRMILIERTREIGTMRALGLRSRDLERLFILEALIITASGAFAGFVSASALMPLVSLVRMGESGLSMFLNSGRLAFSVSPATMASYAFLVLGASSLAVMSPARAAARLRPADALRR